MWFYSATLSCLNLRCVGDLPMWMSLRTLGKQSFRPTALRKWFALWNCGNQDAVSFVLRFASAYSYLFGLVSLIQLAFCITVLLCWRVKTDWKEMLRKTGNLLLYLWTFSLFTRNVLEYEITRVEIHFLKVFKLCFELDCFWFESCCCIRFLDKEVNVVNYTSFVEKTRIERFMWRFFK